MKFNNDVKTIVSTLGISIGLVIATPTIAYAIIDDNAEVIERVSEDTREDAITKLSVMENLREEAKNDWQTKKKEEIKKAIQEEKEKAQRDEELIKAAEEKKKELHEEAKRISEKKIKDAEEAARKLALKTKKLKEKLKKKKLAREQAEKDLGSYVDYSIGSAGDSAWKSYEYGTHSNGTNLFGRSSAQYSLQSQAYVGKYGIFMVDGRYSVAVGSHYASRIGTKIDVYLANGNVIKCILGDQKADKDTDSTNSYHVADGSYLEFIVSRSLNSSAKRAGTIGAIPEMSGRILKFRVYK